MNPKHQWILAVLWELSAMEKSERPVTEQPPLDITQVLADPDRNRRVHNLTYLIVEVRNRRRKLTHDEGVALFRAWREEACRDEFDGLTYSKLWMLLEHAPAIEEFAPFAHRIMENPKMAFRGEAAFYLLHAYPEQREAFIARYNDDPSPEVQNAIAFAEAESPATLASAKARWARILETPGISWDLADTAQFALYS